MKAIKWTSHAATTVVVDDPSVFTGKRVIAECDTEEHATLFAAAETMLNALIAVSRYTRDEELKRVAYRAIARARP